MTAPDKIIASFRGHAVIYGKNYPYGQWLDVDNPLRSHGVEYTRSDLIPQLDPNTRIVAVDMQRGWLDGFNSALDTVKSMTVSVGVISQADIISILQSSLDRQISSVSEEIRTIIGEVK